MRRVLPIIETRDLRKVFRTVKRTPGALGALRTLFSREYDESVAVDGVTMSLEPGELVGYIGPNGAGKSTTIKMLTGILVPTSGEVRVAGLVPWKQRNENARNIGVVFGQRSQLYWDLPLIESFELLRAIYGVPRDRYRRNLDDFIELLEMDDFLRTPVRQLSLGQRMRGDFAAAMLHDPEDRLSRRADDRARRRREGSDSQVHRAHQRRARHDRHPDDARPRRRRAPVPADRADRPRHADLRRRHRAHQERVRTHRTLVVRFSEPVAQPAARRRRARRASRTDARFRFDRNAQRADLLVRQASERYRVEDVSFEEPDLESIIRRIYVEGYDRRPEEDASMILSSGTKNPKIHSERLRRADRDASAAT